MILMRTSIACRDHTRRILRFDCSPIPSVVLSRRAPVCCLPGDLGEQFLQLTTERMQFKEMSVISLTTENGG